MGRKTKKAESKPRAKGPLRGILLASCPKISKNPGMNALSVGAEGLGFVGRGNPPRG
jgi:hypothetical protein